MTRAPMIDIDLFAGPGGLDQGRRDAGHDTVPLLGIEWEPWACRTATAAGHTRVRADAAAFPTRHLRGRVRLLMGAPPCPTFSSAGKGAGRLGLDLFVWAVAEMLAGCDVRAEVRARHRELLLQPLPLGVIHPDALARIEREVADAALVLEPARWIHDAEPEAVVLEQVPAVLPIWQALGRELRGRGWSAWAGVLNAADYGVPQTRTRAILIASRLQRVAPPEPTHAEFPAEDIFGGRTLPWVTMADALGWGPVTVNTRGERTTPGGNEFSADRPSWALTEKARSWTLIRDRGAGMNERYGERPAHPLDGPAPTITAGSKGSGPRLSWVSGPDADAEAVRIKREEAAILQGFPATYPWQGTRSRQFEQIGNAVPPPLAAHCITATLGPAQRQEEVA